MQLQEMVAVGKVSGETGTVRYVEERGGEYDAVDATLERVVTLLPVTRELAGDAPALAAYVQGRALPLFQTTLGALVERKIDEAGAEHRRVRPWESNGRAIARCAARLERRTNLYVDAARVSGGRAVVGAFRNSAQLWLRGEPAVDASNTNEDLFREGLVAIRVEQQAAVTVYRPDAFALVRLRTWPHRLRAALRPDALWRAFHRVDRPRPA